VPPAPRARPEQRSAASASRAISAAACTAGASACHRCPAGSFSVAGASACHRCPAGKFSARGASICTRCPAGSFSAMGASACTRCPAGSFSAMGASACTLCPAGQFASSEGSKQCKACPPGTFSDAAGAAECQKCDRDFALAIKSGMTKCDLCPNGGAALRDNRCYRKLKVSCLVSWPDCERTIDNDVYSYGQALHKKFAKPSTPVHETYFHYKFDAPVNLRGFAVWGKYGCCLKSIRNFKIVASTEGQTHSCFFDGKYDVGKFEFSNYSGTHRNCKYDSVTDLKIEHRYNDAANKIITIAEVAFYAY
uniref:Ephrin_rec_like domain-containing protein n=1 Tax=Macrostomum lignano TaxID=282301 RepID=A0A1I8IEH1_9PLAT